MKRDAVDQDEAVDIARARLGRSLDLAGDILDRLRTGQASEIVPRVQRREHRAEGVTAEQHARVGEALPYLADHDADVAEVEVETPVGRGRYRLRIERFERLPVDRQAPVVIAEGEVGVAVGEGGRDSAAVL